MDYAAKYVEALEAVIEANKQARAAAKRCDELEAENLIARGRIAELEAALRTGRRLPTPTSPQSSTRVLRRMTAPSTLPIARIPKTLKRSSFGADLPSSSHAKKPRMSSSRHGTESPPPDGTLPWYTIIKSLYPGQMGFMRKKQREMMTGQVRAFLERRMGKREVERCMLEVKGNSNPQLGVPPNHVEAFKKWVDDMIDRDGFNKDQKGKKK
ncbi:hypothetical protein HK101_002371 [Irineochytrium annulatum]|nr:hypothetical protein HK101_002371 [Irineochytrium annulatum]